MVSLRQAPHGKGRRTFYTEEKEVERALVDRVRGFSLAESLPGKRRSISSSCWVLLSS